MASKGMATLRDLVIAGLLLFTIALVKGQSEIQVIIQPQAPTATEGQTLTLTCTTEESISINQYTWSRNTTVVGNSSQLVLESLTLADAGVYTCTVVADFLRNGQTEVTVTILPNTGSLSVEWIAVIAVAALMFIIGLALFGLLLFVCCNVCREKQDSPLSNWDARRRKSLSSPDHELQSDNKLLSKRSRSLGHLLFDEKTFDDPYDKQLSQSTERLLSGVENTVHPPENLDFELNLDEKLFTIQPSKKTQSEINLRQTTTKPDGKSVSLSPSKEKLKGTRSSLKPSQSQGSSFSDLGSDSDIHSQASSTNKSVRFDLNDSGLSMGTSTSGKQLEPRRYSAPEVVQFSSPQKNDDGLSETSPTVRDAERTKDSEIQMQLYHDNKVANIVSLLSTGPSDSATKDAIANTPSQRRVSEIKERLMTPTAMDSHPISRYRAKSISPLVQETTQQLLTTKPVKKSPSKNPGKLMGFDSVDGYDPELDAFEKSRKTYSDMPYFGTPISPQVSGSSLGSAESADSDSDDDEVMVTPIKPSTGVSNISPFGKGYIGRKIMGLKTEGLVRGPEMFVKSPSRTPSRKNSASRLSAIPEESPQGSNTSLIPN